MVIDDVRAREHAKQIRRVVLCSGKVSIDLLAHENRANNEDIAIVRVEMLYPFPAEEIKSVLASYPRAHDVVWVQEEPRNMGAWNYICPSSGYDCREGDEGQCDLSPRSCQSRSRFLGFIHSRARADSC